MGKAATGFGILLIFILVSFVVFVVWEGNPNRRGDSLARLNPQKDENPEVGKKKQGKQPRKAPGRLRPEKKKTGKPEENPSKGTENKGTGGLSSDPVDTQPKSNPPTSRKQSSRVIRKTREPFSWESSREEPSGPLPSLEGEGGSAGTEEEAAEKNSGSGSGKAEEGGKAVSSRQQKTQGKEQKGQAGSDKEVKAKKGSGTGKLAQKEEKGDEPDSIAANKGGSGSFKKSSFKEKAGRKASEKKEGSASSTEQKTGKIYIAKKNDTLWELSEKFLGNGAYWKEFHEVNPGLSKLEFLPEGYKLQIPPVPGKSEQKTGKSAPPARKGMKLYTLEPGDNPWVLAKRLYGTPEVCGKIVKANPGLEVKRMKAGAEIYLPVIPGKGPDLD